MFSSFLSAPLVPIQMNADAVPPKKRWLILVLVVWGAAATVVAIMLAVTLRNPTPTKIWRVHPSPPTFVYPTNVHYVVTMHCLEYEHYQCPLPSYIGHTIISATYMDFASHIIRNDDTIILSSTADAPVQMVTEQVYSFNVDPSTMGVRLYMVYSSDPVAVSCAEAIFQGRVPSPGSSHVGDLYLHTEKCPTESGVGGNCDVWQVVAPPFYSNATMWTSAQNEGEGNRIIVQVRDNEGRFFARMSNWCSGVECMPTGGLVVPTANGTDGTCSRL
jgi:hypothetical protein